MTGTADGVDGSTGKAVRVNVETGKGFFTESPVSGTLEAHEDQHRRNILCIGNGQCDNASTPAVNHAPTLTCNHEAPIICLNDQGGSIMNASTDVVAGTLRANTHGNEQIVATPKQPDIIVFHGSQDPISNTDHANAVNCNKGQENCLCLRLSQCGNILVSNGKVISLNSKKYALDSSENIIGCLSASDHKEPQVICYENHAQDRRITETGDIVPTISAKAGTGGGNLPIVAFTLDSVNSNAMKSANPDSGCRETDVANTLDTSEQNPAKNQGGLLILSLAENIISRNKGGAEGLGVNENVSFTLNTSGSPGICAPVDMRNAASDPAKHDTVNRQGIGVCTDGDPMYTIATVHVPEAVQL